MSELKIWICDICQREHRQNEALYLRYGHWGSETIKIFYDLCYECRMLTELAINELVDKQRAKKLHG